MDKKRVYCLYAVVFWLGLFVLPAAAENGESAHFCEIADEGVDKVVTTPADGGIRELVADKYLKRYEKWKGELLSTEFGRQLWAGYADNKNFVLTIKVTRDEGQGAGTTDYQWDQNGNLVAATIVLGSRLDTGYPNPIYFPVVNSLSAKKPIYTINENILAAAKFAHEFGHIRQTARTGGTLFRQQNKLMLEYNEVFRASGYDLKNARLAELQRQLGGTPVEIWANREYWGEANAMAYLVERAGKEVFYCTVINRIETNVKTFAAAYEDRFLTLLEANAECRD